VVSAALSDTGPRKIVRQILANDTLVVSPAIVAEYFAVLSRPKFDRHVPRHEQLGMLRGLLRTPGLVIATPNERVHACRDPADDKYLEAALAAQATVILSGDADLLALDPWRSIRILRPADYQVPLAD
jgi:putative PIN family toxin of toxin-antitoxin system